MVIVFFLFLHFHNLHVFARSDATQTSNLPLVQNQPFVSIGAEFNAQLHYVVYNQRAVSAYFISGL